MNPYINCPVKTTEHLTIRLITEADCADLFRVYHDTVAVSLMNDDNCDFGFYVETPEKMSEVIGYWLDFYQKQYFIRFSVMDNKTGTVIGTLEGFGGETGVLRMDIASAYEKTTYLSELLAFAKDNFYEYFGNETLVTKAVSSAVNRRLALNDCGWEFIDDFRTYKDYFRVKTNRSSL